MSRRGASPSRLSASPQPRMRPRGGLDLARQELQAASPVFHLVACPVAASAVYSFIRASAGRVLRTGGLGLVFGTPPPGPPEPGAGLSGVVEAAASPRLPSGVPMGGNDRIGFLATRRPVSAATSGLDPCRRDGELGGGRGRPSRVPGRDRASGELGASGRLSGGSRPAFSGALPSFRGSQAGPAGPEPARAGRRSRTSSRKKRPGGRAGAPPRRGGRTADRSGPSGSGRELPILWKRVPDGGRSRVVCRSGPGADPAGGALATGGWGAPGPFRAAAGPHAADRVQGRDREMGGRDDAAADRSAGGADS